MSSIGNTTCQVGILLSFTRCTHPFHHLLCSWPSYHVILSILYEILYFPVISPSSVQPKEHTRKLRESNDVITSVAYGNNNIYTLTGTWYVMVCVFDYYGVFAIHIVTLVFAAALPLSSWESGGSIPQPAFRFFFFLGSFWKKKNRSFPRKGAS